MIAAGYFFNKHFQYFPLICRQNCHFDLSKQPIDCSKDILWNDFQTD